MPFVQDLKLGKAVESAVLAELVKDSPLWEYAVPSSGIDKRADIRLNLSAEIKYDAMASKTGNIAIEVACNGKPSGLSATSADLWVTVLLGEYEGIWVSSVADVRYAILGKPTIKGGDRFASEMVLLKAADFIPLARRIGPAPAFLKMIRK